MEGIRTVSPLGHISQEDIECDTRKFVDWLNNMADIVNWLAIEYPILADQVRDNTRRIECLEERVDDHERRIKELERWRVWVEQQLQDLQNQINNLNIAVNALDEFLQWIKNHLPTAYGNIPADWKFALGNINVMSDNNETPSIQGAGIYTSMEIEDNDIYFN